jgi:acetyl-CoA carboxylase carboxyltransferase component
MGERVARSRRRHAEALQMGGQQAVSRHRASGRLPVRERVALLLDEGSWYQTGVLAQPERAGRQAGRGGGPRVPGTAVDQPRKDTFADLAAEHRGPGRDPTEDQL